VDHPGEGLGRRCIAQTLEDQEIDVLVAQGETEVVGKSFTGPLPLVENGPARLFPLAAAHMLFCHTTRVPDRRLDVEGAYEG
jgi:hypothetical protein